MPKISVDGVTCRKRGVTDIIEYRVGNAWLTCGETAKLGGITEPAVRRRAMQGLRGSALLEPAYRQSKPAPFKPAPGLFAPTVELSDEVIETVRRLRKARAMSDDRIAVLTGVPLNYVLNIKPKRGPSRDQPRFAVGDGRELTVPEIARESGTSRGAVYARVDRGVTGAALLLGRHKLGRGRKTAPMPAADEQDVAGQSASPSFIFEDEGDDDE